MLLLLVLALLSLLLLGLIFRIARKSRSPKLRAYARRYLAFIDKYCGSDPLVPLILLVLIAVTLAFS